MIRPRQATDVESIVAGLALVTGEMDEMRLTYYGKSLVGLNRSKLAGSSYASGLFIGSPYLHPALRSFAASLPIELLRAEKAQTDGKYVLKLMAERVSLLPPEIIHQKKASPVLGFADYWYLGELRDVLLETMQSLPPHFNQDVLPSLLLPRRTEEWFRNRISLGHYALNAAAFLSTYAAYSADTREFHGEI
jgi:hypothetical protein